MITIIRQKNAIYLRQGKWHLSIGRFLVFLIIIIGATGCRSNYEDIKKYINQVKTRPSRPIEPIPEFETPVKFEYPEEDARRSPFKPIKVEEKQKTGAPDINRPKQPLEAYPLDALKFVGVFEVGSTVWALIAQPDGMITRVKSGDYMGKNYGQIMEITKKTIEIQETVQLGGQWEKRATTLKLNEPE